jgi:hypothetical protein
MFPRLFTVVPANNHLSGRWWSGLSAVRTARTYASRVAAGSTFSGATQGRPP